MASTDQDAETQALQAEVKRLRQALDDICHAECCGCLVYAEIATAALEGKRYTIDYTGVNVVQEDE